jgi:protein CpxP
MRRTLVAGLGLALTLSGVAAAQQPEAGQQRDRGSRFEKRGGAPAGFLLRGIELTDAQKQQIKELRESERAAVKANREQLRERMKAAKEARQSGDTAKARQLMVANRELMAQSRERQASAIRAILTPDQRVQFDRNVAEARQRVQERAGRGMRGNGQPGHRSHQGKGAKGR